MKIIDGKKIAENLRNTIAEEVEQFSRPPGLAVILVGDDEASQVYVKNKSKACSDIIAEMDVIYEYCIEAVNECGESDWDCDDGFVTSPGGDVNGDGSIDVLDIVLMVTIIIETYEPSVDEFLAADLNDDGVIDVLDIVLLVNIILS